MKSQDQTFQQRWEFRRKESEMDSSSDDDRDSNSGNEPNLRKRNLLAGLIQIDEEEEVIVAQEEGTSNSPPLHPIGTENGPSLGQKLQEKKPKKKFRSGPKRDKSKNRKSMTLKYDPSTALQSLEKYVNSLVEEMKTARENLSIWMEKEFEKLISDGASFSLAKSNSSKKANDNRSNKASNEKQVAGFESSRSLGPTATTMEDTNVQATTTPLVPLAAENENARRLETSSIKSLNATLLSGLSNWPIIDPRYITLPAIHSQPQVENCPANPTSSCVNIQPVVFENYKKVQQPPVEHCRESRAAQQPEMCLRSLACLGRKASNPMHITENIGASSSTIPSGLNSGFHSKNVGQVCSALATQGNSASGVEDEWW